MLPGLEQAVEFWKLVFTRYSTSEVIFHDPTEPTKIYKVIQVGEDTRARRIIANERSRILAEHGLKQDQDRVRAQRGIKERFAEGLQRSRRHLEQMRRILEQEGVPADLSYLPLIESSFVVQARSRVGAVGMWQFMRSTGKRFLHISRLVDERKDPLESTRAAARFLKENHEILGNWPLAITAYNHGREGIQRAIGEVGSTDLVEMIRNYRGRAFGYASKNFYAEFLAAVEVAKKGEEFFPDLQYHPPYPLGEMELERSVSIAALLRQAGVSRGEFLEWNPALSPNIRDLPKGYRVKIPQEKFEPVKMAYDGIPESSSVRAKAVSSPPAPEPSTSWSRHRVAAGETLSQIAKSYRISVRQLQQVNGLSSVHRIAAGQLLKIPAR